MDRHELDRGHGRHLARKGSLILVLIFALLLSGCWPGFPNTKPPSHWKVEKAEPALDFRWAWDKGVATPGKPGKINPEYDDKGNLIVPKEVSQTYQVPDVLSGFAWDVTTDELRALVAVEVFEVKLASTGWWAGGLMASPEFVGAYFDKRVTSVIEVQMGVFGGRDLAEDEYTWGVNALIIKF